LNDSISHPYIVAAAGSGSIAGDKTSVGETAAVAEGKAPAPGGGEAGSGGREVDEDEIREVGSRSVSGCGRTRRRFY